MSPPHPLHIRHATIDDNTHLASLAADLSHRTYSAIIFPETYSWAIKGK